MADCRIGRRAHKKVQKINRHFRIANNIELYGTPGNEAKIRIYFLSAVVLINNGISVAGKIT